MNPMNNNPNEDNRKIACEDCGMRVPSSPDTQKNCTCPRSAVNIPIEKDMHYEDCAVVKEQNKEKKCDGCKLFSIMGVHSFTCPIRSEPIHVSFSQEQPKEYLCDRCGKMEEGAHACKPKKVEQPKEELKTDKVGSLGLTCPRCGETSTHTCSPSQPNEQWDYGSLTFDEIETTIRLLCNVKSVVSTTNSLTISFAPKNVTGTHFEALKGRMLPIIEKLSVNPKSING